MVVVEISSQKPEIRPTHVLYYIFVQIVQDSARAKIRPNVFTEPKLKMGVVEMILEL